MIPICHIQVLPILSGVQRAMLEMFRHLDRSRFQPHVICQQAGPLSEELVRWDIPCHFVPSLVRSIHPWHDACAYREFFRLFRRHEFQLVHTHSSKPGVLGRVAARRAGVPWVVHHCQAFAFHDFTPRPIHWFYSRLERLAGLHCDRVIFCNHEERKLAVREGLLPADKCLTIHNGVDLTPFALSQRARCRAEFRAEHGIPTDSRVILFLGRFDVPKQPLLLPEITRQLEAITPDDDWRLVIVGFGPMEQALKQKIADFRLEHRVKLIGWVPEAPPAYHAADLFLQPSLWEGLPLAAIEAHAAGLPVVGSQITGIREVVTNDTGSLCPPHDARAFAVAIATLLADPTLRLQQGQAARRRARQHFDGDVNMRRVAALYDELFGAVAQPVRRRAA